MFTLQETYETSCLALVEQGEPARDGTGCRYLTEDGRRCAAGHLMATADPGVLLCLGGGVGLSGVNALLTGHDLDLVGALQSAHEAHAYRLYVGARSDRLTLQEWRTDWLKRVCRIAKEHEVDPTRVLDAARAKGWEIPEVSP